MKPASLSKLDKHLREVDDTKAYNNMRYAVDYLSECMSLVNGQKYEDAYPKLEDAKAYVEIALEHLRELVP